MSRSTNPVPRRSRWGVPALCALVLCSGAWAQTRNFDIPAGEMKAALDAYAAQSGLQLVYKVEDLRGLVSPGLRRAASAEEALQALIRGSVLSVRRDGRLPARYVDKREAERLGWRPGEDLCRVARGRAIGGDHFGNYERRLPERQGRSWREADLDLACGRRGARRLVFSSDRLVYVTTDHYQSFREVPR